MKKRHKPPSKSARKQNQLVERLAAAGLNGDVIAEVLGVNKNQLRSQHAVALYSGRKEAEKLKAEPSDLSRTEACAASAILSAFDGDSWRAPDGRSDLWSGLDGGGAKSPADAYARWLRDGGRFITTGIDKTFGPERLADFVTLKIEAQRLLSGD